MSKLYEYIQYQSNLTLKIFAFSAGSVVTFSFTKKEGFLKEIEKRQGNKEKIALLIVLFTLTLLPDAALSKVYSTREKALKSSFPQADKIDKKI